LRNLFSFLCCTLTCHLTEIKYSFIKYKNIQILHQQTARKNFGYFAFEHLKEYDHTGAILVSSLTNITLVITGMSNEVPISSSTG